MEFQRENVDTAESTGKRRAERFQFANLPFAVEKWTAWSPALETPQAWTTWAESDALPAAAWHSSSTLSAVPSVGFLPLTMRKRLSALCKVFLYLLHAVLDEEEQASARIVMASRFGESSACAELLELIGRNEGSSPLTFSRSVHNSAAGHFSIAARNRRSNVALSAMENTFRAGLLEALLQLHSDESDPQSVAQRLVFVFADEGIPVQFQPFVSTPPVAYGAAFMLCRVVPGATEAAAVPFDSRPGDADCCDFLRYLVRKGNRQ
jgi:hypothetical protein